MLLIDTYLGPSRIDGIGVFTRNPVEAGALIWELISPFDRLIEVEDYERLSGSPKRYMEMYCYPYVRDKRYLVLEADDARYMNHSHTPNCEFTSGDRGYALCKIPAGGELTCDYRSFFGDAVELLPSRNGARPGASPA